MSDIGIPALSLNASLATNVTVISGDTGVALQGGSTLADSSVTARSPGVRTSGGGSVERSTINATSGNAVYDVKGDVSVSNSSLTGLGGVEADQGDGLVHDTLIRIKPSPDADSGVVVGGLMILVGSGSHQMSATNVTVVGDGQEGEFAARTAGAQRRSCSRT